MNEGSPVTLKPTLPFLLEQTDPDWKIYQDDPFPPWGSGNFTLFNSPKGDLTKDERCHTAIYSIPFDSTSSTRVGSRKGPLAIRQASQAYSSQQKSRSVDQLYNIRTDQMVMVNPPIMVDFGDLHIYPSDPKKQTTAIYAEVNRIMMLSERVVMLGGEHTVSIGNFYGVASRFQTEKGKRLGYVQIDHHFDFGDQSKLHGNLYHGCNGRRIAEHPELEPSSCGFVGQGDLTSAKQFKYLLEMGFNIRTIPNIRKEGFEKSLRQVLDQVSQVCDELYISIDIDVCENATAPGTGHVTVGGINSTEFMSMASILHDYPVVALDLVEVSPDYDPGGATASLAARFLFEWIYLHKIH
ncbi:arginase family protein [Marinoscillum luteum]|uniref:Arginase family protein n=1 Tax=Marinoscillum luteum TaxID=861051 RepID=A0ABW7N7C0_9BACT